MDLQYSGFVAVKGRGHSSMILHPALPRQIPSWVHWSKPDYDQACTEQRTQCSTQLQQFRGRVGNNANLVAMSRSKSDEGASAGMIGHCMTAVQPGQGPWCRCSRFCTQHNPTAKLGCVA